MADAVISMTSWPGRLPTLSRVVGNLVEKCPGFRVVINLCRQEFAGLDIPYLPAEINWVDRNTGPFKKVLPTVSMYPDLPVISADDDALYSVDYARMLVEECLEHPGFAISNIPNVKTGNVSLPNGYCTIYPPHSLDGADKWLTDRIIATNNDDCFYGLVLAGNGYGIHHMMKTGLATFVQDSVGLGKTGRYRSGNSDLRLIIGEMLKAGWPGIDSEIFRKKWMRHL